MKLRVIISVLFVSLLVPMLCSAQRARVAGLEGNKEYITLLTEEVNLKRQEDSLTQSVKAIREKFSSDTENRSKYSADILKIEGEMFEVRNKLGMIVSKITAIEQDFIINSLNSGAFPMGGADPVKDLIDTVGNNKAMITENRYFEKHLSESDNRLLTSAQGKEGKARNYFNQYVANNSAIVKLESEYSIEQDPVRADSLISKYNTLVSLNLAVADSLKSCWEYIFDNKSYIYSYILDKLNKKEQLDNYAKKLAASTQKISEQSDMYADDKLVQYAYGKKLLTGYELIVADQLKLTEAADSLKLVADSLVTLDYKLPKVDLVVREFIEYDSVEVVLPTKYSTRNPIPEAVIPPKGIIYRIMLGSYTVPQHPSIFKGAQPMSTLKENGRYNYYVGGLRTLDDAVAASEYLKKKWLKNPRIIVWEDGVRREVDPESVVAIEDGTLYRVEVVSTEPLGEQVLATIKDNAPEKEISRVDNKYIIGTFTSKTAAQHLMDAINAVDDRLEVTIIAIES